MNRNHNVPHNPNGPQRPRQNGPAPNARRPQNQGRPQPGQNPRPQNLGRPPQAGSPIDSRRPQAGPGRPHSHAAPRGPRPHNQAGGYRPPMGGQAPRGQAPPPYGRGPVQPPRGQDPRQRQMAQYNQPQPPETGKRGRKAKKDKAAKAKGGVPRWLLITLDILIVVIIGYALYLFIKPMMDQKNAEGLKQQLLDEFEKNKQVITVNIDRNFGAVTGERYEDFGLDFMDNTADHDESDQVSLTYVGRLSIPKIKVITPLAADVELPSLRFGSGIHPEFAPINSPGLTTIFGHRFLTDGKDFNRLEEIVPGDQFYIDYAPTGKRYYYDVFEQVIIPQAELLSRVYETFDEDVVVLITCHPPIYGESRERLLVYARLDPNQTTDIPD